MKKITFLTFALTLIISCGNKDKGELVGVKGKRWHPEKPYGMSLIPGGAFTMGKSDDDIVDLKDAPTKTVTVRSFYMDETEITNSEYRQFVHWVRDSIIRINLAEMADLEGKTSEDEGIGEYSYADAEDPEDLTPYERFMLDNYGDELRKINRDVDLIFDTEDYPDELYAEVMDGMYLPPDEWYNGQRTWDVSQFNFEYTDMDIESAAEFSDLIQSGDLKRSEFVSKYAVNVYPDTTVWIKDFNYSYNEPMHNDYFSHPAYQDYPVVGISWKQAVAFCNWRTHYKNSYQKEKNKPLVNNFRLPTEAEWEYAARGGIPAGTYPWGSPYLLNDRGCFLANFKPLRGDYSSDQAMYAVEAKSFLPNDYNLYNMSGNVSEWTESSYDPGAYEYVSSLNPNMSLNDEKRKVVRGGSWKDVAYFLRVSSRDYEYQDTARSYIGFRTVQDYLGSEKIKIK